MEEEKNMLPGSENILKKEKLTPVFDLFESAVSVWWKNLIKFIFVGAWGFIYALIPLAIMVFFGFIILKQGNGAPLALEVSSIVIFTVCFAAIIYFLLQGYVGVFLLVKKNYEGGSLETFKEARKYVLSYIGLALMVSVFVLLWSLLLIIPGIIYSILYSLAIYVFFFEGKKGMAAIKRSKELVKGYWWAVFGRVCFLAFVMWIFGVVITVPLSFMPEKSILWYMYYGLVQLANFLIGPISLLFSYQIYKDLVRIKK